MELTESMVKAAIGDLYLEVYALRQQVALLQQQQQGEAVAAERSVSAVDEITGRRRSADTA